MRGFIEFTIAQATEEDPAIKALIKIKNIIGTKGTDKDTCEIILENDIQDIDYIEVQEHYQTAVAKLERALRTEQ